MVSALCALLVVSSCTLFGSAPKVTQPDPDPVVVTVDAVHTVTYHVDGSGRGVSLTAKTPTGTAQGGPDGPLSKKAGVEGLRFTDFRSGDALYLSAQNGGVAGALACEIQVDGVVVSRNAAAGAFSIATCQATMP
jgi:hypothetical protein